MYDWLRIKDETKDTYSTYIYFRYICFFVEKARRVSRSYLRQYVPLWVFSPDINISAKEHRFMLLLILNKFIIGTQT